MGVEENFAWEGLTFVTRGMRESNRGAVAGYATCDNRRELVVCPDFVTVISFLDIETLVEVYA